MSLPSVVGIDCSAITISGCTANSSVNIFGSHSILLEKVNFPFPYNGSFLGVYADNSQRQSVGLRLISCTWARGSANEGAGVIHVGGGIAKSASQGIQGCNFANNSLQVYIQNDKSAAYTYFSFANNVFAGNSLQSSLLLINANPNVVAQVSGNQFTTLDIPGDPGPIAAVISGPANASGFGSVFFSNNDVWAPVVLSGGGRVSVTGNKFSNLGQILAEVGNQAWGGPLTISSNSFSLSGQTSNTSSACPILVELSPTDSLNKTGPVTIQNNKCTSTVTLPGYIVVLDAANDKTTVSGNTVAPAGAVITVVHTQAALDAVLQQLSQ